MSNSHFQSKTDLDEVELDPVFSPLALLALVIALVGLLTWLTDFMLVASFTGLLLGLFVLFQSTRWELSGLSRNFAAAAVSLGIFSICVSFYSNSLNEARLKEKAVVVATEFLDLLRDGKFDEAHRLSRRQMDLDLQVEKWYASLELINQELETFKKENGVQFLLAAEEANWVQDGEVGTNVDGFGRIFYVNFVDTKKATPRRLLLTVVRETPSRDEDGKEVFFWHVDSVEREVNSG
jgi:hypothetical protein